jgi:hypothetical protein
LNVIFQEFSWRAPPLPDLCPRIKMGNG